MKSGKQIVRCAVLAVIGCLPAMPLAGQDGAAPASTTGVSALIADLKSPAQNKVLTNYVETGGQYLLLTNGFGMWNGGYARSVMSAGNDTLNGEVVGQREFGDLGTYFAAGDTHTFTSNTFASVTAGSSIGGFFWPRFRADAFVNHKWLSRKQLITTIGVGYYASKDPHRDRNVSLGTTYYFAKPWILENGLRFNLSNPGTVLSTSGFVAVTQGHNKSHYLTARVGYGEEAYQLIGPADVLNSFHSQTVTITWRQWIGTNWGANSVADYYGNPYYSRAGASLGLFREF